MLEQWGLPDGLLAGNRIQRSDGLIGHWPLQETTGPTITNYGSSGSSGNGTTVGVFNTDLRLWGPGGGGIDFDSSSSTYMRINDILGAETASTVSFWFRVYQFPTTPGDLGMFISKN